VLVIASAGRDDGCVADGSRPESRSLPGRLIGRVVGSVVDPIVDQVDVGEVVDRIDVDALVTRIDIDGVIERVDINALLDRIEVDDLLDRIDPDRLLDRVDPNRLLDRVDPDRLLDRVDANRLLDRVDPDRLLDRVDPDRLIDRVDANRLIERVDVNGLLERTELGAIITRSTTGVFTQLIDVARVQITAVDLVTQAVPARILRRVRRESPARPDDPTDTPELPRGAHWQWASLLQRHYAGSVSRFLAFALDQFLIGVVFALGAWLIGAALAVVVGETVDLTQYRWLTIGIYTSWAFLYTASQLAASGRTIGKAVLGLRVVRSDGAMLEPKRAVVRTVVFPLSFVLFGFGFLIGLLRRDRRELHDLIARTAVIYDWDAKTATLRSAE
jgi:uncharacterized RDD family membrane protein YckC